MFQSNSDVPVPDLPDVDNAIFFSIIAILIIIIAAAIIILYHGNLDDRTRFARDMKKRSEQRQKKQQKIPDKHPYQVYVRRR